MQIPIRRVSRRQVHNADLRDIGKEEILRTAVTGAGWLEQTSRITPRAKFGAVPPRLPFGMPPTKGSAHACTRGRVYMSVSYRNSAEPAARWAHVARGLQGAVRCSWRIIEPCPSNVPPSCAIMLMFVACHANMIGLCISLAASVPGGASLPCPNHGQMSKTVNKGQSGPEMLEARIVVLIPSVSVVCDDTLNGPAGAGAD